MYASASGVSTPVHSTDGGCREDTDGTEQRQDLAGRQPPMIVQFLRLIEQRQRFVCEETAETPLEELFCNTTVTSHQHFYLPPHSYQVQSTLPPASNGSSLTNAADIAMQHQDSADLFTVLYHATTGAAGGLMTKYKTKRGSWADGSEAWRVTQVLSQLSMQ